MHSLSSDVLLLILGYINTKRDLKSLCLTSQHLRTLSLPRLYHTVYLHTGGECLPRFFKCIAAGASFHLRYVRSLSFEDELLEGDQKLPELEKLEREAGARDVQMRLLIFMLPEDCLRAFKFIAGRTLRIDIFHILKNSQRELCHLQLRSLSHWHMDLTTQALQDPHVHIIADSKSKLLNLPHLRLYNIDADLIWSCLATTIDFTNLKTLALYNCEIVTFCEKFVSSLNGRSTALEHVYATIVDDDFISDLLVCSENLTSLHLIWTGSCTFEKFWSMIERRGPGLKSLGMQHLYAVDGDWDDSLLRLLSICRNVQHLRIPIPFDVMKFSTWKPDDDYEDFVDHFEQMSQLRSILFTYDAFLLSGDSDSDSDSDSENFLNDLPDESDFQSIDFANEFFQHLDARGWCPDLDVLVTGRAVDLEGIKTKLQEYEYRIEYEHPHQWHCFLKSYRMPGHTKSGPKEKTAVAVRVPAHVLRSHQPGYNMPDIIPRAHWMDPTAGESWGFLTDSSI